MDALSSTWIRLVSLCDDDSIDRQSSARCHNCSFPPIRMDETCDNHCQAKVLQPLDRKSIFLSNRMITVNRIQNLFVGNLMFVQDVVIINRDDAATKVQLSLWQEILTLRCKD